jgi:hypothetical protein
MVFLSVAVDFGVEVGAAFAVDLEAASVGRTLLSDAFDFAFEVDRAVDVEFARVRRTSPPVGFLLFRAYVLWNSFGYSWGGEACDALRRV